MRSSSWLGRWSPAFLLALAGAFVLAHPSSAQETLARGDAAWLNRAEGAQGGQAAMPPIAGAIGAYEEALRAAPTDLEARWKLMRALWFAGEYATRDETERQKLFARATEVGEESLDLLAKRVGGRQRLDDLGPAARCQALAQVPQVAAVYFWTAASWGVWGEAYGKLAAARKGVGSRIRDDAETVIACDESFDHAGGHRVLGRLHSEAPKIPFFTGWVDRDRAIRELERAVALDPDYLFNRFYLAEALLDHRPRERQRAISLLRALAAATPDPRYMVEDADIIAKSRQHLAELR